MCLLDQPACRRRVHTELAGTARNCALVADRPARSPVPVARSNGTDREAAGHGGLPGGAHAVSPGPGSGYGSLRARQGRSGTTLLPHVGIWHLRAHGRMVRGSGRTAAPVTSRPAYLPGAGMSRTGRPGGYARWGGTTPTPPPSGRRPPGRGRLAGRHEREDGGPGRGDGPAEE